MISILKHIIIKALHSMLQPLCKKKNAETRCSQCGITRGCSKDNFAANGEGEEPALFGVVEIMKGKTLNEFLPVNWRVRSKKA